MPRKKKKPVSRNKKDPNYDWNRHGRRYTEATRLGVLALKDSGLSNRQIAIGNDVSPTTVARILEDKSLRELKKVELDSVKKGLIAKSYLNALNAQASVDQKRLDKSSFVQLMVGSKIGVEMGRLMEEKSTANIAHRGLVESIQADRERIMAELQSLSDSESANNNSTNDPGPHNFDENRENG